MTAETCTHLLNVLVVDDDDSVRDVVRIALSFEGGIGEIRESKDGVEAVTECRRFDPDLVLLDYWMPLFDGGAVATAIRDLHPDAFIVAFSGSLDHKPEWADAFQPKTRFDFTDLVTEARARLGDAD